VSARGAWVQIGPYLRPTFDRDDYPREFRRCLERGVLLNPDPNAPSILPGEASAGELDKISKLLNNDRGG